MEPMVPVDESTASVTTRSAPGTTIDLRQVHRLEAPDGRRVEIEIRPVATLAEVHRCEELQERVWGPRDLVRVPAVVLVTASNNGGFVLGAFASGRLVGFVCSYLGLTPEGRLKQCSQLMAVDPDLQHLGIGYRLKLAQRDCALAQGLDLVTWTFDPLSAPNAYLNVRKLGCLASVYLVDFYGTCDVGLNAGLASDRLLAEWWLHRPGIEARAVEAPVGWPATVPPVNHFEIDRTSGLPAPGSWTVPDEAPELQVVIPDRIAAIKAHDLELARRWRLALREILESCFRQGYRVEDFGRLPEREPMSCGYLLRREVAA